MYLTLPALLLSSTWVTGHPIDNPASDQACYYKRSLDGYFKRTLGGAEIACSAPTLQNIERSVGLGILPEANNACYYKRELNAYVRRDAGGAEVACNIERDVIVAADLQCYYKRDSDGKTIGYRRDSTGAEVHCNDERHEHLKINDNACYYKRNEKGVLAGYMRDETGAEILCK